MVNGMEPNGSSHRARDLIAFRARAQAWPRRFADDDAERALFWWLDRQRKNQRQGRLHPDVKELLDAHAPGWDTPRQYGHPRLEDVWARNLASCQAYVRQHGHLPSISTGAIKDGSTGSWLSLQRVADRKGRLTPGRRAALDAALPGWDTTTKRARGKPIWERATDYVAFTQETGHRPYRLSADPAERSLARWFDEQRRKVPVDEPNGGAWAEVERALAALPAGSPMPAHGRR